MESSENLLKDFLIEPTIHLRSSTVHNLSKRSRQASVNISVAKVYGVVTFYSFFTMIPMGEHPISICMGTACYVRGAEQVLAEFKRQLSIEVGQSTADNKFSLNCLRCVGACGLAPVVMVGEKVYGRVAPQMVKNIIAEYKEGCASEAKTA